MAKDLGLLVHLGPKASMHLDVLQQLRALLEQAMDKAVQFEQSQLCSHPTLRALRLGRDKPCQNRKSI